MIRDFYPTKALYRPGEPVTIRVELDTAAIAMRLVVLFCQLHRAVHQVEQTVAPDSAAVDVTWLPPAEGYAAYGVEVALLPDGPKGSPAGMLDYATTAFEMAEHWERSPRYGFVTDFDPGESPAESQRRLGLLSRMHVNCLLFYDWMETHHRYLPEGDIFTDTLGRRLSMVTIRRKIRMAHQLGMAALAYGALYGAEEPFVREHPDWALYRSDGEPFSLARLFYIMDFRPGTGWANHLLEQYRQAVSALHFDGIHVDQYGWPKRALPYPGTGQPAFDLGDQYVPFLNEAHQAVTELKPEGRVFFSIFNNWPVAKVAAGPQAALYIYVFSPNDTFRELRFLIQEARALAPGKPVIVAAFLSALKAAEPELAERALLLLWAAIHANGGTQMAIGEGDGVLAESYFPQYSRLSAGGLTAMRRYADFSVRYSPLMQAPLAADVSSTHFGGINQEYSVQGYPASPLGVGGAVWTLAREHEGLTSIHLINLLGSDGIWQHTPDPHPPVSDLSVTLRTLEPVAQVWSVSPDWEGGKPVPVRHRVEPDPYLGHRVEFTVPRLELWTMILVEYYRA